MIAASRSSVSRAASAVAHCSVGEVAERVTPPQGQRVVVGLQVRLVDAAVVGCVAAAVRAARMRSAKLERVHRRRVDVRAVPDAFAGDDVADADGLEARRSLETRICSAFIGSTGSVDSDHSRSTSMVAGMVRPGEQELGEQGAFGGAGQGHGLHRRQ